MTGEFVWKLLLIRIAKTFKRRGRYQSWSWCSKEIVGIYFSCFKSLLSPCVRPVELEFFFRRILNKLLWDLPRRRLFKLLPFYCIIFLLLYCQSILRRRLFKWQKQLISFGYPSICLHYLLWHNWERIFTSFIFEILHWVSSPLSKRDWRFDMQKPIVDLMNTHRFELTGLRAICFRQIKKLSSILIHIS